MSSTTITQPGPCKFQSIIPKDQTKVIPLRFRQARQWVDENLEPHPAFPASVVESGMESRGSTIYRRRDGQPITLDDIEAVRAMGFGQVNMAFGSPGDMTVEHWWKSDSSDCRTESKWRNG